jgi:hypothetical protein
VSVRNAFTMERNLRYVSKNYRDPSKNDAEMNAI